ncbi:hypothetical protein [Georgenia sp. AZ-5]|uniref:hypothetical protein n=1 Tax=Georgenia sp. AZ-5 TaxID=3367526 RepID=UPI0037543DE9
MRPTGETYDEDHPGPEHLIDTKATVVANDGQKIGVAYDDAPAGTAGTDAAGPGAARAGAAGRSAGTAVTEQRDVTEELHKERVETDHDVR